MSFLFLNPPPSQPNLHSHFFECGNLSCDTAEIRLGNSVRIVLDMVLVAPIWGRRTAIWTLGTRHQHLSARGTGPWPSPVPWAPGRGHRLWNLQKKLQKITIIYKSWQVISKYRPLCQKIISHRSVLLITQACFRVSHEHLREDCARLLWRMYICACTCPVWSLNYILGEKESETFEPRSQQRAV